MKIDFIKVVVAVALLTVGVSNTSGAQGGVYAAASRARPVLLTLGGGMDIADNFGDAAFPFGSVRLGRDVGHFFTFEASAQFVRLSYDFGGASDPRTDSRLTIPQAGVDGTVQFQLPMGIFAPYIGAGSGYYRLSGTRYSRPNAGFSTIGLAGVRVALTRHLFLGTEIRAKFPRYNPGSARDIEMGGSVGMRF